MKDPQCNPQKSEEEGGNVLLQFDSGFRMTFCYVFVPIKQKGTRHLVFEFIVGFPFSVCLYICAITFQIFLPVLLA